MKNGRKTARKDKRERRNSAKIDWNGRRDCTLSVHGLNQPKTALESAVQRYVDLYDFAPVAYVSFDRAGRVEEANLVATELLHESRDLLIGRPFAFYVADLDSFLNHLLLCRTSQQEVKTELLLKNKKGQPIPAVLLSTPITSTTKNGVLLYQTAILDLRALKSAEAKLRTSEERYKTLFDLVPVAVYTCDADGIIQEYNQRAVELWGRELERNGDEPRFCGSHKIYYSDGRPMPHEECPMARALRGEKLTPKDLEIVVERPGGEKRHVIPAPRVVTDERGNIVGAINCLFDITERKQAEAAVMRLAAVVQSSRDAIAAKTLNGIITDWNQSAQRIFGYKPKEIIGKSILTLIPKDRQSEEQEILRKIRLGESLDHYETVRRRKDGQLIDVSLTISPIKDSGGETIGVSKIARDITEQKQTMRRLAEQARLLDLTNDAIIVRDHDDRIVYWNRGAEEMYGFSAKEALGKITHELLQTAQPENYKSILKNLGRDQRWSGELVHTRKDGTTIVVFSRWSVDRDARGRRASILETNTDVTARKRAEQQQLALYQFSQRQHSATNVDEIHDAALDAILSALDCHRASILLFDNENVMRFVAWRGLSGRYRKSVEGHSPWKPDAKSPKPVCINDIDIADIPKPLKSAIRAEHIRAVGFIPLISGGRLIGKFMTYYDSPHKFTAEELKLASTIATQLAQAIEHKRDEEALRYSERELARDLQDSRLLQQTSAQLIHQDDTQALYEKILDAAVAIMRSEFASIQMLYPERGDAGELYLLGYRGYTRKSAAAWKWIGAGHATTCGVALRTGKRCIVPDVQGCDWLAGTKDLAFYRRSGVRSLQSTPLFSRTGETLGMISTGWKQVHEPSVRDLRLLDVLGRQAADLIEAKRDQEALRQSEERLRAIVQEANAGMARYDSKGRIEFANSRFCKMLGYQQAELVGKTVYEITYPHDLKETKQALNCALKKGEPTEIDKRYIRKDGSLVWVSVSDAPEFDAGDRIKFVVAVAIDITARKKAEEALREKETELESIVTKTPFMLTRCTRDLRYRYVSRAYAEFVGRKPEELAGKSIVEIIGKKALKKILPYLEKVFQGRSVEYEMEIPFQGIGNVWLHCVYTPDRDSDGNVVGWFASLAEVGRHKEAEALLQKSNELLEDRVRERTRALHLTNKELKAEILRRKGLEGEILEISDREQQRLAQELHDGLCQHLTAVAFMARSVGLRLKNHRVIEVKDIEKIAELVNNAASDTRNLSHALHRVDVDAAGLVGALEDLVDREMWRTPCRLEVKPSFHLDDDAVASHLYRIAREAVINANKHAQAREIVVGLRSGRKGIVLTITDDGVGLKNEEKRARGLGFHIMNYRARLIGGQLKIESPDKGGTCVACYLPNGTVESHKRKKHRPYSLSAKLTKALTALI
jgi:PAS domain S-box-containing protein